MNSISSNKIPEQQMCLCIGDAEAICHMMLTKGKQESVLAIQSWLPWNSAKHSARAEVHFAWADCLSRHIRSAKDGL